MSAVVTLAHCRALGYCASGMRAFFKAHGLNWDQFRNDGLPAEVLENTGDAMAQAAADLARREKAGTVNA